MFLKGRYLCKETKISGNEIFVQSSLEIFEEDVNITFYIYIYIYITEVHCQFI